MESNNISIIRKHLILKLLNLISGAIIIILAFIIVHMLITSSGKGEGAGLFFVAIFSIILLPSLIITTLINLLSILFLVKMEQKNTLNIKTWEKIFRYIFIITPFGLVFWWFFRSIF